MKGDGPNYDDMELGTGRVAPRPTPPSQTRAVDRRVGEATDQIIAYCRATIMAGRVAEGLDQAIRNFDRAIEDWRKANDREKRGS